jgi:hypothetical protein
MSPTASRVKCHVVLRGQHADGLERIHIFFGTKLDKGTPCLDDRRLRLLLARPVEAHNGDRGRDDDADDLNGGGDVLQKIHDVSKR